LELLYEQQLVLYGKSAGFVSGATYWSSTVEDITSISAWIQDFGPGKQSYIPTSSTSKSGARAVRAF
jgi:hypothetical protein